jgi:colanic acid biosynthesis glycosyl transferase WcaI
MRILYLSQYFPPEPGAPAARVSELAKAWVEAGHEVTVLTAMPNHPTGVIPPEYAGKRFVREQWHGVDVCRTWIYAAANKGLTKRSLAYASFSLSASMLAHWRVPEPDVVLATSPQLLCGVAGAAVAAFKRKPFVLEVRDLWPESIVAVGALPRRHPVIKSLEVVEKGLYRAADHIVVVTDAFKANLESRGVPGRKLSVIKNGVDLTRFKPADRRTGLRDKLGWHDKFVCAYIGTHGMAHGLDAVLDTALHLLSDERIRFLFVGEGAERTRLQKRIDEEGISNTTMLGVLPRDAMNEIYATADLCLVPLRKTELFTTVIPSKIFEIFGMARPILLSVDGEARSIVEGAEGGRYVPPEDVPQMVAGIQYYADNQAEAVKAGVRGEVFVRREFDRSHLAADYVAALERVLADGRRL